MMQNSVEERLKLKRTTLDVWSTREKLSLASAVQKSGDQNWACVSRSIRSCADCDRPSDWYSQKNCALQYASLLEKFEVPKRKKRSAGSTDKTEAETREESIIRNLKAERIDEILNILADLRVDYAKIKEEINAISNNEVDDQIPYFLNEIEEEKAQKEREKEQHMKWLQERDERKIELERILKSGAHHSFHRPPSISDPSSDADSPLSEPLNVDVPEEGGQVKPTPTSPLLSSLLKSPSSINGPTKSLLQSAITSPRGVSPTITSILRSPPGNHMGTLGMPPSSSSQHIKTLVSNALGSFADDPKPLPPSPSQGAPTLSMLLELPPSMPGKPLPVLQPPAPPPYSEHLGPPPPYPFATAYLQKQRDAEAAAAVQVKIEENIAAPAPSSSPVAAAPVVPRRSSVKAINFEQSEDEETPTESDSKSSVPNPTDHNYVGIKVEKAEESIKTELDIAEKITERTMENSETASEKESRLDKKTELDVFDFDEDAPGDAEESIYGSLKKHRQAKKEADSQRALKAEQMNKRRMSDVQTSEEALAEALPASPEETTPEEPTILADDIKKEVTEKTVEAPMADDKANDANAKAVAEESVVEVPITASEDVVKETVHSQPEVIVKKEKEGDAETVAVKDKADNSEVLKGEEVQTAPDLSTTEDEKSNEAPSRASAPRRRGTITLSASESVPNSPASTTEEEKDYRQWKKSVSLVLTRLIGHKSASLFSKPITDDQAPGYSSVVRRPMDLGTIKKNIESGVIRTTEEFNRDVLLMFFNAIMYNKSNGVVHHNAMDMQKDCVEVIQMLQHAADDNQPTRRETRTQDRASKGETTRVSRLSSKAGKQDLKRSRASNSTGSDGGRKKIKLEANS